MTRLPPERREVYPSRRATGGRKSPTLGRALNVSIPISFGLPLVVVGIALIAAAASSGSVVFWIAGGVFAVGGIILFASGKRI